MIESTLKGNFLVKDKWRKAYHEDELAMLNNAAGAARTEMLGPPGTNSLNDSEDDHLRQNFHMNTLPPEDTLENESNRDYNNPNFIPGEKF